MSQYVEYWKVESDSKPGKFYTVSKTVEGSFECGCTGWTRHVPRRDCRHILYVKAGNGIPFDPCARAVILANARQARKVAVS